MIRTCATCGSRFEVPLRGYRCPTCRDNSRALALGPSRELRFRERQIVALVGQAKANKEIAWELCLTEGTVKVYLTAIYDKLGVPNRTALARLLQSNGGRLKDAA